MGRARALVRFMWVPSFASHIHMAYQLFVCYNLFCFSFIQFQLNGVAIKSNNSKNAEEMISA